MRVPDELREKASGINEAIEALSKMMRIKLASGEIDEYRELKVVYDKLNEVLFGKEKLKD